MGGVILYEQLSAAWRLGYIQGEKLDPPGAQAALQYLPDADCDCFLCQSVADANDRHHFVVDRTEHSLTLLNRYPYNNGHLLVSPRRHRARLDELTASELLDLAQSVSRMVVRLEQVLKPTGFNVGLNLGSVAGAGLPGHLHWHIVPRWNGDTNFMPAVAAVKVIPQSLESLWEAMNSGTKEVASA